MRVAMGAFYLKEARNQLAGGWIGGDGLERTLRHSLDHNSIIGPYRWFLDHLVLNATDIFTLLVIAGEIAVGAALIAGFLTRFTAVIAFSMNLAFFLMNAGADRAIDGAFLVGETILFVFAAYQALSVDG